MTKIIGIRNAVAYLRTDTVFFILKVYYNCLGVDNFDDDEIDDDVGKGTDDETNEGIENGVFGLFELARIAGGGHILNATDDDGDDGDESEKPDNAVDNVDNDA